MTDAGLRKLPVYNAIEAIDLAAHKSDGQGFERTGDFHNLADTQFFKDWRNGCRTDIANGFDKTGVARSIRNLCDGSGLKTLASFKNLKSLNLQQTKINGTGFKELAGHPKLVKLQLAETDLKDVGMNSLVELTSLTTLDLRGTLITDGSMKSLVKLKNLTEVDLANTRISDIGLKDLAESKSLSMVDLTETEVTDTGLLGLRANLWKGCQLISPLMN